MQVYLLYDDIQFASHRRGYEYVLLVVFYKPLFFREYSQCAYAEINIINICCICFRTMQFFIFDVLPGIK